MELDKIKSYQQILLHQAYFQEIQQNEENTKSWTKYKNKYQKIIEGLQTLSSELSLNCMVPLGKKALMKGKLTHTNEILICIGDGYFVKYTAQQAIALCNRRIQRTEEMLQKLEKERNLLEMRQMLPLDCDAFEFGDCKDINEHWDDTKVENWKVDHRKKEKEYRQKLIEIHSLEKKEIVTEDDLFKRLDQLELEEELADELARLEEEYPNFHNEEFEEDEDDENAESDEMSENEELKEEKQKTKEIETGIDIEPKQIYQVQFTRGEIVDAEENLEKNSEDVNGIIEKSIKQLEAPIIKDTKIKGKFEVSIIREEEVEKTLGKSSLRSDNTLYNSTSFEDRTNIKSVLSENTVSYEFNICSEKSKVSGRRVSFAERYIDYLGESTSEDDPDLEDIDDTIVIKFRHTETQSLISEVTKNGITSPQDIYRIFCKPKSILKRSLNNYHTNRNISLIDEFGEEDNENDNIAKPVYNSVVQDVLEKEIDKTFAGPSELNNKKRRISRFKLERTNVKK